MRQTLVIITIIAILISLSPVFSCEHESETEANVEHFKMKKELKTVLFNPENDIVIVTNPLYRPEIDRFEVINPIFRPDIDKYEVRTLSSDTNKPKIIISRENETKQGVPNVNIYR